MQKIPIHRLILGFCTDLTDPNGITLEVGVVQLKGNDFESFLWTVDYTTLDLNPLIEQIFAMWPQAMRRLVQQWPAFRDSPSFRDGYDPDTLVEFIRHNLSRSSIFVLRVEEGEV